jgi:hypothetical protein
VNAKSSSQTSALAAIAKVSAVVLENLQPAVKVEAPQGWRPAVEFDGTQGEATTGGYAAGVTPDFQAFLLEFGYKDVEIIGTPKSSHWQSARAFPLEPIWLTAYKFNWRLKSESSADLPLLYSQALKRIKKHTPVKSDKAFVVLWSDLQVGKVASRGGTPELIERCLSTIERLTAEAKRNKPEVIVLCDVGDIIENFGNAADLAQLQSNDLSLMAQVDLATTLTWELLKRLSAIAPVTYASVGSNHCQFRVNKQRVGMVTDDWGVHIGRTLARLAKETDLGARFLEPQPHDESLVIDVFGDGFHRLGLVHGHQANRPEGVVTWWQKQSFGQQPVSSATILASGHFHHLRVQEVASNERGASRYWIQASTLDNGSDWYRLTSGEDSTAGAVCFALERGKEFAGTVWKV